jgi:hypothetical protein
MKKLLAVAILFLASNCFAPAKKEKQLVLSVVAGHCMFIEESALENVSLETVRQSTRKRLEEDVPTYLCAKALKSRQYSIAEYIGNKFQIKDWQRSEELCAVLDVLSSEKPDLSKQLEKEFVPLVRESMIEKVAQDSRADVLAFIRANPLNKIYNISK